MSVRLNEGFYWGHLMRATQNEEPFHQIEIHVLRGNYSVACLVVGAIVSAGPTKVATESGQFEVSFRVAAGQVGPLIGALAAD